LTFAALWNNDDLQSLNYSSNSLFISQKPVLTKNVIRNQRTFTKNREPDKKRILVVSCFLLLFFATSIIQSLTFYISAICHTNFHIEIDVSLLLLLQITYHAISNSNWAPPIIISTLSPNLTVLKLITFHYFRPIH